MSTQVATQTALALTGSVLDFNGTDGYIAGQCEDLRLSYSTPFTLSLRIYPRQGSKRQFIVHIKKPHASPPDRGQFHINLVLNPEDQLSFQLCAHGIRCGGVMSAPIALNSWHDVEASSDGQGNVVLTVDGVAYSETITSVSPTSNTPGDFSVGCSANGQDHYDGKVENLDIMR